MKTKFLNIFMALFAVLALTSCGDEDTEGLTRVTYYPALALEGGETVVNKGETYQEPGYTCTMAGEDVTSQVTVSGKVDTSKSGIYTLTYTSPKNEDGFGSSTTRQVVVIDPNDPVEGIYDVNPEGYRVYNGANTKIGGAFKIYIFNEGDSYAISDFFGGWYDQRAAYGSSYACAGHFTLSGSTISLVDSSVEGWGDALVGLANGTFDAATSTISYDAEYVSGMHFFMTLNKR